MHTSDNSCPWTLTPTLDFWPSPSSWRRAPLAEPLAAPAAWRIAGKSRWRRLAARSPVTAGWWSSCHGCPASSASRSVAPPCCHALGSAPSASVIWRMIRHICKGYHHLVCLSMSNTLPPNDKWPSSPKTPDYATNVGLSQFILSIREKYQRIRVWARLSKHLPLA